MTRQTASIYIRRPPSQVYQYMDDVSREGEWQPNLRSASQDPHGPSRVGTRKRYVSEFLGREIENTYVIVEVDPGRRVVSETTPDSAAEVTTEVTWDPEDSGTRVTMSVEGRPRGFMKLMPRGMLEAAYRKELSASLQRLKERLEV